MSKSVEDALVESLKKPSPMRVLYGSHPKRWPFGTTVHVVGTTNRRSALVLRDDPANDSFDGMLLYDGKGNAGTVLMGLHRPNWEPDTP